MKDEVLINQLIERGKSAKEKAKTEFSSINESQLNWKSHPEKWSIGQCFEHLINADSSYFPILKEINEGSYKMSFWAKYSPLTGMFGRVFKKQMGEQVKMKLKAPKKFFPTKSDVNMDVIERYQSNLDTFLKYISKCRDTDLDKTIITSPVTSFVTYSLRDTLTFLISHEHRHINQAIRVKAEARFPRG